MILKTFYILMILLFLAEILVIYLKDRERLKGEAGSAAYYSFFGFLVYIVTSFGVSDSALNTLVFRRKRYVPMEYLPGTMVTCAVVPFCTMSYAYIAYIDIDLKWILIFAAASAAGSYFGASVVSRCRPKTIRRMVMTALFVSACIILAKLLLPVSGGAGDSQLTGAQMVLAAACVFLLMAFGMVGLSSTAPIASIFMLMGMPGGFGHRPGRGGQLFRMLHGRHQIRQHGALSAEGGVMRGPLWRSGQPGRRQPDTVCAGGRAAGADAGGGVYGRFLPVSG